MSTLINVLTITLCMNLLLSLGGISLGNFDSLNKFIEIDDNSITPTEDFSLLDNTTIPTNPNDANSGVSTSDNTFIDTIKLTFNYIFLLLVSLFFPIYWGFYLGLPIWLTLFLAILTIISITSAILVWRGTGS